jgi:metallophosphoesterase superfamily enzyme
MLLFEQWRLLPQRFAVHEPTATAVLADLHLGYSAARQLQGDAIPWRSVADEMQPFAEVASSLGVRAIIVAGDLFESGYDAAIFQQFLDVLAGTDLRLLGVVPGNHDRGIDKATDVPLFPAGYHLGGWRIIHGDQPQEGQMVMGHWHPAIRKGRRKAPCFLIRGRQLILPAYSLDAAGVDVQGDARWKEWKSLVVE